MEGASNNWLRLNVGNMNPLSISSIIDDATMIRLFGRDRFLYLKFLKYQSWFFLCIFVLGWTILMPTYNTGKDAEKYMEWETSETTSSGVSITYNTEDDDINMLKFTILNVTNDGQKLIVPYLFTIVTTLIMYVSIFCFWKGTRSWSFSNKHHLDDKGYSQLHKNVLLLKGIPRHIDPEEANRHIKRALNMVEGLEGSIFQVKTVEDFGEYFNL